MPSTRHDEAREYGFADRALALRERAGLTQDSLAALLGVSKRAIQTWEAGTSYPGDERLRSLITLYLARGAFEAGREEEEAAALWDAARGKAARRLVPFDPRWFASLRQEGRPASRTAPAAPPETTLPPGRYDWGEAPDAGAFHGRTAELATLSRWLLVDRCRLVGVLGMGGIGKTLLAARLAREVAPAFSVVYWRSLRNAPPVEEWLAGAIAAFAPAHTLPTNGYLAHLALLLELLQTRRGLLVLDNLETILVPGASLARYREGYAGYGEVLRRVGESMHQSCLLVTAREGPPELAPLVGERAPVRTLWLGGLVPADGQALLRERGLSGDDVAWEALIAHYGGNPLALRVVGDTIGVVFGGDITAFLGQETTVFGGIRQLLDAQVERLSALERSVLHWLAVEREPVGFAELLADLLPPLLFHPANGPVWGPGVGRGEVVEAVEALGRRSLLERGGHGAFTLQPVVLEYATTRLIDALAQEILAGQPALLVSHALLKAQAKEYVRHSQERLLVQPLLDRLSTNYSTPEALETWLLALLELWRGQPVTMQGYGPGNVVNLLRLLRGDLRGLDLSRLVLQHAYLHGVEAQDASLLNAHLSGVVLAEVFNFPTSVAFDAGGAHLAVGTSTGEVYVWRVADRTLLLALQGHTNAAPAIALSADGQLVACGSVDGTVKLWATQRVPGSGQLLASRKGHDESVWCLAVSADGRLEATGSVDGTVKLWATQEVLGSGQVLATLQGHAGGVLAVALSRDGQLVASGGDDGTVKLWKTENGQLTATLQGHAGGVLALAVSGDGRLVASGSRHGTITLWEAGSGRVLATLQGQTGAVRCVALNGDGQLVASSSHDGTVTLREAPSGGVLATLRGHANAVRYVALSEDGRLVASSSIDGAVTLWQAASGQAQVILQGHISMAYGVALSRDGRLLANASQDGSVRLWEVESGQLLATLQGHTGLAWSVTLSGDGRLLASGGEDGTVRLWEIPSGRLLATLQGHTAAVWAVALSRDGRLLGSASQDGTVKVWETQGLPSGGQLLTTLKGHTSGVSDVALSGDGRLVASASYDGTIKLWATGSGQLLATMQGHTSAVRGVALSEDGGLLASASYDGTAKLWATDTEPGAPSSGRLRTTLAEHTSGVLDVALSGDGMLVATSGWDGTVKLWEVSSGICLRTLRSDRRYERMNITGLTGVTEAQRTALLALGAIEGETTGSSSMPAPVSDTQAMAAALVSAPLPQPARLPIAAGTPDRSPTNIPPARTSFVGRTADLATLTQVLDPTIDTGARLLTLIGVAGCGKTRLALALAEAVRNAYRHGVWLVELALLPPSTDANPMPVAAMALSALDLHEQPGQNILDTLIAHLQPRRLLLVLDNCEHVVDACAALAARLLAASPDLQILATSQRALGITGETDWRVAPLTLPPSMDSAATPEALRLLGQSDAVQLFVQRAQAVHLGFVLSAETAPSVVAICQRLDGLPLAIELAAARLNVLPVEEILVRLDDRFRLLRRGGRTVADRHQALQATMDWSFGLLAPAEQAALRRLAVFVGGWELAAAEAVCAGPHWEGKRSGGDESGDLAEPSARGSQNGQGGAVMAQDMLALLDELLDRSLVFVQQPHGVPRYGMLETVRHYGAQQLEHAGEAALARNGHLAWCVTLAEQAAAALQGPDQAMWLARLEREHDNMRAALRWALDRELGALGLRLAAGLWQFWRSRRSYLREGRRWLAALLALATDNGDTTIQAARANALEGAAWLAEDEHDFAQATTLLAQSTALRSVLGPDHPQTGLLVNAAMEARASGEYARATALLEECLAQHRALGNRESIKRGGLGLSLSRLALVLAEQGEYARATALYEECLALHGELGDQEGIGSALMGLGDIARDEGDTAQVRAYCEESLALFGDLGHNWVGFSLNNLALAAYLDGDLALAASHAVQSAALFRGLQALPSLAEVLITLGRITMAQGEVETARATLAEALTLAWAKGPRFLIASALEAHGMLAVRQGQARHAVELLAAAATLRRAMGTPVRPADRPALEGALAVARVYLDGTTFVDAWATGETLPTEQLVARALAGPEDGTGGAQPTSDL